MIVKFISRNVCVFSFLGLLTLASCESDEEPLTINEALPTEEIQNVVLTDDYVADIEYIIEDNLLKSEVSEKKKIVLDDNSDCFIRTIEETENGKIVTLNFGEGCEGRRGRIFAGKIIIEYAKENEIFIKETTFEEFSVDDTKVFGNIYLSKVDKNDNGNPERVFIVDMTMSLSTGEIISKKGERIKEMIEGSNSIEREDDVFLVIGFWESVNKNGKFYKTSIKSPLKRKYACKYIVSGVSQIIKETESYVIDFGDGECDNLATITDENGVKREIVLKDKRKSKI
ncbi:hypothetical protein [Tenacibaculum sp. C7A-26P2]|uniref:hypothetical protein n=1 Tax=Tenacibaculum sp. C7A-26P2 TaxID=3447504 RepID=UPI003F844C8D